MINFLPPEAKAAVRKEYVIRTGSVWAVLLALVALIGAALLIPTYVLLLGQLDALAMEVVETENATSAEAYKIAHSALEKAQTLALQLRVDDTGPTPSQVLRETQKAQTNSISISGFSYQYSDAAPTAVEIRGVAATREALAQFSAALERNPLFARAEVPVSDLAEARDLPFTLAITLAQSKN
jgi:hypothetical protein